MGHHKHNSPQNLHVYGTQQVFLCSNVSIQQMAGKKSKNCHQSLSFVCIEGLFGMVW
jgi:hypothetical protein